MKYLIISADDLGLSDSINRGIVTGYEEGIVTSPNVMPAGNAFDNAVTLLRTAKVKEIGAHLALTEVNPVSEENRIPTLLASGGSFRKSHLGFACNFLSGKIAKGEIYFELKNQLERLKATGIPITSLSSHEHIHILPGILEIFIRLSKEYEIPAIRHLDEDKLYYPYTVKKIYKKVIVNLLGKRSLKALDAVHIVHPDNLLGFCDSGNMREELVIKMLNDLPDGVTELVTHPGFISAEVLGRYVFHRNCETDLAALVSRRVKKVISDNGIKLIPFSELARLPRK